MIDRHKGLETNAQNDQGMDSEIKIKAHQVLLYHILYPFIPFIFFPLNPPEIKMDKAIGIIKTCSIPKKRISRIFTVSG